MSPFKTIAMVGVVAGLFAVNTATTEARTLHHRTHGAFAAANDLFVQEPRGVRMGRGWGRQSPRATVRPMQSWDPYAKRWDGGGGQ